MIGAATNGPSSTEATVRMKSDRERCPLSLDTLTRNQAVFELYFYP